MKKNNLEFEKLNILIDSEKLFASFFQNQKNCFWLDSALVCEDSGRFSFLGQASQVLHYFMNGAEIHLHDFSKEKIKISVINESLFSYLNRELAAKKMDTHPELPFGFQCGFVGYFGYELKNECKDGNQKKNGLHSIYPDASFFYVDRMIVLDHLEKKTYLVKLRQSNGDESPDSWFKVCKEKISKFNSEELKFKEFTLNKNKLEQLAKNKNSAQIVEEWISQGKLKLKINKNDYLQKIAHCLMKIELGESYELCLTNQAKVKSQIEPFLIYWALRNLNSAPFSAFLDFDSFAVLSSSPERFLKLDHQRQIEAKPIKGTIRRGKNKEEDQFLIEQLKESEKDQSENLMIVDLLRNDLSRVCEIGSVTVPKCMEIETFASVHQMVSTICGKLKSEFTSIDLIQASFPGGSMTGAPKKRSMDILDELEMGARGIYSGALGYLSLTGAMDLNIVIRTLMGSSGEFTLGAGGAITALSDPESEFAETLLKWKQLILALQVAEELF